MLLDHLGRPMDIAESVHIGEAVNLEEPGWIQMGGSTDKDAAPGDHRKMGEEAWKAYLFHPMGSRQVEFITSFIAGLGFKVKADDQEAQPAVDAFVSDPANRWDEAHEEIVRRGEIEGEAFVVLFQQNGKVVMREIEPAEIEEIICDPDDVNTPLWYFRAYRRRVWSGRSYNEVLVEQFIPALGATNEQLARVSVPLDLAVKDRVVTHIRFGGVSTRKRGVSPMASHLSWMRRYSAMLVSRDDNLKARSSWAWDVSVDSSDAKVVNAYKDQHKKPPRPGSINVHSSKVVWEPMAPNVGAGDAKEDLRAVKMMSVAGSGLPEHALTGDASNGNFASSKVQDMPMIKLIESRQKRWSSFWRRVFGYVMAAEIKAGTLPSKVTDELKGEGETTTKKVRPIRTTVTCMYPEIYMQSAEERLKQAQAARLWGELGVSNRTLMGQADFDYDAELDQSLEEATDERLKTINAVHADVARDLDQAAARLAQPDEPPEEPPE